MSCTVPTCFHVIKHLSSPYNLYYILIRQHLPLYFRNVLCVMVSVSVVVATLYRGSSSQIKDKI